MSRREDWALPILWEQGECVTCVCIWVAAVWVVSVGSVWGLVLGSGRVVLCMCVL